jgi:hypothetical protein
MWLRLHFYAGVPGIAKSTKGVISLFISSSAELKEMKDEFLFAVVGRRTIIIFCRVDNPLLRQPLE